MTNPLRLSTSITTFLPSMRANSDSSKSTVLAHVAWNGLRFRCPAGVGFAGQVEMERNVIETLILDFLSKQIRR